MVVDFKDLLVDSNDVLYVQNVKGEKFQATVHLRTGQKLWTTMPYDEVVKALTTEQGSEVAFAAPVD